MFLREHADVRLGVEAKLLPLIGLKAPELKNSPAPAANGTAATAATAPTAAAAKPSATTPAAPATAGQAPAVKPVLAAGRGPALVANGKR